jgi:hypothetical protein
VQQAIYETTPEPMRRRFHGRIAEYLLQVSGDRPEAARAIGYHFARSDEPTRAIDPLLRAAERALDDKALLEASGSLELAARLLEDNPEVADRAVRLITAWGTLIEIGYGCSAPTCIHYAEKLFAYWGETADLARGQVEMRLALAIAATSSAEQRAELLPELFQEIPIGAGMLPRDIFLKRAEYRILESIALALTGRTAELAAGLRQTAEDHPPESPYRAAASVAIGGLTPHTGQFRGVVAELREHIEVLRMFRGAVATCPRRLEWALGMGAYFMNLNLAVMGLPIDERATWHGLEIAERLGFTDLRSYHALSQLVRASFTGDGAAFTARFAELTELMRKLGDPRLSGRDLAIYTPLYYLERGELELARAAVQRGERLVMLVPGDHWLASYVEVYRACLLVAGGGSTAGPGASTAASATGFAASAMGSQASMSGSAVTEAAIEAAIEAATAAAITRALSAVRTPDFRMATLVLVYQSRFELGRGDVAAASAAAEAALARATDPLRVNPFDEILARRALADVRPGAPGLVELSRALALAVRTRNVLQEGIVRFALADRTWDSDRPQASQQLDLAEQQFAAARADRWLERARRRRKLGGDARP